MKTTAALGTATRTLGKMFLALALLLVAVAVGFGGTALFVYHQFGASRQPNLAASTERNYARPVAAALNESAPATRRVAALPSDQPHYTYADNTDGQPTATSKHSRPTAGVPAALDPAADQRMSKDVSRLDDPESRYIVDERTGRVIGIDGSDGARRDAAEARVDQAYVPPVAVAVQTPPPEVRVASAVMEDGAPIFHDAAVSGVNLAGSQYVPVRKAQPVFSDDVPVVNHNFNAGEYMMNDVDRPVLRAIPVVPAGGRAVKTVRIFRLPDGSQSVAAD